MSHYNNFKRVYNFLYFIIIITVSKIIAGRFALLISAQLDSKFTINIIKVK